MPLTKRQVRTLQKELNAFTDKYLLDVTPVIVDGDWGPATKKRVRQAKYYLGQPHSGEGNYRDSMPGGPFRHRLRHPRTLRYSTVRMLARGVKRRREQRAEAKKARAAATKTTGASSWRGGKVVANWLHPYLDYARENGWQGQVNSGWRDPVYSEQLCLRMCGAPSCPGRCAGRNSNHAGSTKPHGAIDVSDYVRFGQIMRDCPLQPRIWNGLGQRDPVHFSASGR